MNTSEIIVAIFASTGFWAVVNTAIQAILASRKKEDETLKLLKEADVALLHDKIYWECSKALRAGEITADAYHNLACLVDPYFKLGGNGTAHKLWEDIQELPIKN